MKKHVILSWLAMVATAFGQADRPARPNIVVILTDDLGWQDVNCYDIDEPEYVFTPNIDALASRGVKFWQAYSPAPTCTPSRAAIVSGMHPARSQCTHINGGVPPKVDSNNDQVLITPWYSGRMSSQPSIAETLKAGGYATGMTGKWHNSANLFSYPQPSDVGFDLSTHNEEYMSKKHDSHVKGIQDHIEHRPGDDASLRPIDYSTSTSKYPLDENGYPIDPVQVETLKFIKEHKDKPFFLFNSTWLVHAPIQCRSEGIVTKYYNLYLKDLAARNAELGPEEQIPVEPLRGLRWSVRGANPYYHGMIETLDYYVGQTLDYLESTDDPRWPGHKLIENTYIMFTSDNGGVISARAEQITENTPLTIGKKYTNEGGIRVPFIISGPGIAQGVESKVMINGLDIYPTVLSWAGVQKPEDTQLDGADLSTLLAEDPQNDDLVLEAGGKKREKMFWHFPHSTDSSTVVRDSEYKLVMNYGHEYISQRAQFELYKLSDDRGSFIDLAEAENLDAPLRVQRMHEDIEEFLEETNATKPYFNPDSPAINDGKNKLVPTITDTTFSVGADKSTVEVYFDEHGAEVVKAFVIYKLKDDEGVEWFREEVAVDDSQSKVKAFIVPEAKGAIVTLVDENNFGKVVVVDLKIKK